MLKDLNDKELELAEYMSSISEQGYSAAWMKDLEFDLWKIVKGSDRHYGRYELSESDIDQLKMLSEKCGSWIVFDDFKEETAIKMADWTKIFAANQY